ncbi:hypothetical protein Dtox_1707 [Desulfofarcimen acetoxidans DSM 771]|jgi:hypothetical protein|uniref:Uncharacterized protein n=1 Tax=Desulfofarcimen acetoxidans (strain ATCC 49208 / DSM 771 / KCTC 5769 / VKM B-1644 / 5575) TaxID=485916 RepID=C8VWY8_DESAS|nr:hypothetical protein [Desulfofarcimen acetoxidans]ACV62564.1 hypothetical protein Dtox_1707 [Desulfofarcimen acetoxidans DSM 771]
MLKGITFDSKRCIICGEPEKPGYLISRNKYNASVCDRCEIKAARHINK